MRKYKIKIGLVILALLGVLTLGACAEDATPNEEDVYLDAIEIDTDTVEDVYQAGDFSVAGIELILTFSDDFVSRIRLSENMILTDISSLTEAGTYEIDVKYSNLTTSFDIVLSEGAVIEDVTLYEETYDPYALIDTFDISDITLEVTYSDESVRYVNVTNDMLSINDVINLSIEGVHDFTVTYEGRTVPVRIAMFEEYPELEEEQTLDELIFYEVMNMLMMDHYKNPTKELLFEGALLGMIDILDDPFTNYFDAEAAAQYQSGFEETYVGIGVRVQYIDDNIVVEGVINGGAAEEEGIMVGDIIRTVDGVEVSGQNLYEVVNNIIGEEGTFVDIGVERVGVGHLIIFHLERRVIDNPTVLYEVIEREGTNYGLITVSTFGNETATKFNEAVYALEQENIEGLIVDLRNNGGGRLDTVLSMLRVFLLNDGQPIFSLEYLSAGISLQQDLYSYQITKKPYDVVTLINGGSASASEVFASAMQEHGEYTIIGTTSYGKGTMQSVLPVSVTEGDTINITIGKWLTANNNWVHYQGGTDGIVPDIESPLLPIETAWKIYLEEDEEMLFDTVSVRNSNLQVILNGMGYTLRTDGYYDLATQQAIEDIQAMNDLDETGNVDQATIEIINAFLREYQNNADNDSQLNTALAYFE
jgi:carboxyl-terminal processing protease